MDDTYRPSYSRSSHFSHARSFQPNRSRAPKPSSAAKEVQGFWAHVQFVDANGQTHSIGRLGSTAGAALNVKLFLNLTPVNGSLSLRALLVNGLTGTDAKSISYAANYPRHSLPNLLNEMIPAGFSDLVCKDRSTDTNFPEPPTSLESAQKITHHLSWTATSALTSAWHSPVPIEFSAPPEVTAELATFHLLDRATKIEAWIVGAKYIQQSIDTLLQSEEFQWMPKPTTTTAGNRLSWSKTEPLNHAVASQKARFTFSNDFEYEMAFKTAILRESQVVVQQTEALLQDGHLLALAHLHPARTLPRNPELTAKHTGYYKAYVRLSRGELNSNGDAAPKLDAGLKVVVGWPRQLCHDLGIAVSPSEIPPTWSGTVVDIDSEAPWSADFMLILRKPANLPAPYAAEPSEAFTVRHTHCAMIRAQRNDTSAKRQWRAVTAVAQNPASPIWRSLLNQQVVALPFDINSYNLLGIAEHYINRQQACALEADQHNRTKAAQRIEARIIEEEAEKECPPAETPVSATSTMLDGLSINAVQHSEWDADAPMPDAPTRPPRNPYAKSSAEMQRKEDARIKDFTETLELSRRDALLKIERGDRAARRFASTLNKRQLLAFNSSCRANPGFSLLTGPPGTGKSFLITRLVAAYAAVDMPALVTAPSNQAVNVLATALFRGSNNEQFHFSNRNSLGLFYNDIVRVYPDQEEEQSAKFPTFGKESDDVLLHLMQEEAEDKAALTMKHLSLAGHIHRLANSTRGAKEDPWMEFRLHITKQPTTRPFRTCYREIARAVISRAKIVLATLNSCQLPIIRQTFQPCLIVVDEAGQANEPDLLIPFSQRYEEVYCRFVAGDEKQLPPTVLSVGKSEQSDQLLLPFFSRLKGTGTPTCTLDEQYRMVPDISALPNRVIYRGELKNHESTMVSKRPLARDFLDWAREVRAPSGSNTLFYNVKSSSFQVDSATHSRYNQPHLAAVVNLLEMLLMGPVIAFPAEEVNVLCYYKAQRSRLVEYLRLRSASEQTHLWSDINVHTVDSYQGKERDIIILDLVVRGEGNVDSVGFVRKDSRLNVALSRARNGLIIVGNAAGLSQLKEVKADCLLVQLGLEAMKKGYIWTSHANSSDWRELCRRVQPQIGTKRRHAALSEPVDKPAVPLDPWELEEFRTGKVAEARLEFETLPDAPSIPATTSEGALASRKDSGTSPLTGAEAWHESEVESEYMPDQKRVDMWGPNKPKELYHFTALRKPGETSASSGSGAFTVAASEPKDLVAHPGRKRFKEVFVPGGSKETPSAPSSAAKKD